MNPDERVDKAVAAFEGADREFIVALAKDVERPELARLAGAVSQAAEEWETAAYALFFELRDKRKAEAGTIRRAEISAENAEVLHSTWSDLHEALSGRVPPPA